MTEKNELALGCPTLAKHFQSYEIVEEKFELMAPDSNDLNEILPVMLSIVNTIRTLEIYETHVDKLIKDHSVFECERKHFLTFLEFNSLIYLTSSHQKFLRAKLIPIIDELIKISTQAEKLQTLLASSTKALNFANFVTCNSFTEDDQLESLTEKYGDRFLSDTDGILNELVKLPIAAKTSAWGIEIGLSKKGPTSAPENMQWVNLMHSFWVEMLGRTFNPHDNPYSGRSKFLNFIEDCFEPLYPNIKTNTLRNCWELIERKRRELNQTN